MSQQPRDEFAQLFEAMPDAALLVDVGGVIVRANRQAEVTFRVRRQDLAGRSIEVLLPAFFRHEDLQATSIKDPKRPGAPFELTAQRRQGAAFWAQVHTLPIAAETDDWFAVIVKDMSARRKNAEDLRRSNEHLVRMQRLETVGSLAAGVAHDLNNLLSVVLSCTTLALDGLAHGNRREDLEEALRAAECAAELTRRLLTIGRVETPERRTLDPNETLAGAEKLLQRLLGEGIQLVIDANAVGRTDIDPVQLEQILFNLAVNARDAMPRGGQLTIETTDVTIDATSRGDLSLTPGPYIRLAVIDTGTGIDAATRAHIFEPFFTTKRPGKGTGLGLSTVLGIVQRLGGDIRVTSEVGHGATFEVFLPRQAGEVETAFHARGSLRRTG